MTTIKANIQRAGKVFSSVPAMMKLSLSELRKNDPLRMAGATSFFTTFAVTPILIIIIQILSVFFTKERLSSQLIERLREMLGYRAALQIQETLKNIGELAENWYAALLGFVFLMFVATTLFLIIEDSLNQLWGIRIKPDAGFLFGVRRRMRSLIIILLAGVLFTLGLITEGFQVLVGNYIDFLFPDSGKFLNSLVNEGIFVLIVTIWFTCLFLFLTEGRPVFRIALAGGFLTTVLFTVGKMVVNWGLSKSNIGTIYGASGSIVLIQLFVFYSSLIFYFGGSFIKVMSDEWKQSIRPLKGAFKYEIHEIGIRPASGVSSDPLP